MNWLLMRDGLVLGEFMKNENGLLIFKKDEGIGDNWLPPYLELLINKDVSEYLAEWLKERVIPENRIGIKRILKLFELKEYDYLELAKATRASLMSDP